LEHWFYFAGAIELRDCSADSACVENLVMIGLTGNLQSRDHEGVTMIPAAHQ
jgi:hypothetical protein